MNLDQTLQFLRANPEKNYIWVFNNSRNVDIPNVHEKNIFLHNIPNGDIASFIKQHVGENKESVYILIEHRTKNGAQDRKVLSYRIEIKPVVYEAQPQPANASPQTQAPQLQQGSFLGLPDIKGLGQVFEILESKSDAKTYQQRYEDKKEQVEELKEQIKELKEDNRQEKKRLENLLDDANSELRKLRSELAIKDREREVAIKEIEAAKKSFLDTEGAGKIMDVLKDVGMALATKGEGGATTALNAPAEEGILNDLIVFIKNEAFNDQQIGFLGLVASKLNNQNFVNQLNIILNQTN